MNPYIIDTETMTDPSFIKSDAMAQYLDRNTFATAGNFQYMWPLLIIGLGTYFVIRWLRSMVI